ncbi:MAG: histidine--tRNA ligase [Phascolarctobacterium sp.]|nr:histidine--tRNA ligase [Phascolarctobacterium sp.]
MLTTAPRGTKDIMPADVAAWRYLEDTMRKVCAQYGYKEIRTPVFEHTELFLRGIGETTDVVEKEMYTFTDRGDRSLTLRPENTASAVRAFIEHKLYAEPAPTKLFYIGPMFRYDRPQAGRYRQFHQFGIEALGVQGPNIDAEIILLAVQILQSLGLKDLKLKINSVGCPKCRPEHREKLQEFFKPNFEHLCKDCQSRYDRNPLRLLDCKVPKCQELGEGAPSLEECLCEECKAHFEGLKELLTAAGIEYEVDHNLVRGLDYYTKTAFEIQYSPLGAQSAVCGGGRYDGLIEEVGGPATPGIGFAMGMERVLLALESQNLLPAADDAMDVFVVCPKKENFTIAFKTAIELRRAGFKVDYDFQGRSMKAQMKAANRVQAKYVLIFGEDEVARGQVVLRNMANSEQNEIALNDIITKLQEV